MEKKFYSDIEYNRAKRRSSIILNSLLIVVAIGTASMFVAQQDYLFMGVFLVVACLPIALIPISFKNHPVHGNSIITVTDNEITVMGETARVKDITKIKVLIELPPAKDDREGLEMLKEYKSIHPGYEFYGNLDMIYVGKDGKKRVAYSHVCNVIEALEAMIYVGVKNYSVTYSAKKNTMLSDHDFKNAVYSKKQEDNNKLSKKQKTKQLI